MTRQTPTKAGFTVIELLVAMGVFAMAAVFFTQAFVNTLAALDRREAQPVRTQAVQFVRSTVILEADLETFLDGGEIETLDAGTAFWNALVEPTEIPYLHEVKLTFEFSGTDQLPGWTHEETLHLLRPTWAEKLDTDERFEDMAERIEDQRDDWNL